LGSAIGQRLEQDAAHDRKHRGGGADPERHHGDRGDGERRVARQDAEAVAEVAQEVHRGVALRVLCRERQRAVNGLPADRAWRVFGCGMRVLGAERQPLG
jgi:hypothetical protein